MLTDNVLKRFQSLEEVFQLIQEYHNLKFSELLKEITQKKGVSINKLFNQLQEQGYYMSLESLYRYFNSSPKSNRFPPQNFIIAFSKALDLPDEQTKLLIKFWLHYKLIKKCTFKN